MARLTKKNLSLLSTIVAAMAVEATPFAMVTAAEAKPLIDAKLAEQNPDIVDGDKIATRATEAGIAKHNEAANAPASTPAAPSIPVVQPGTEGAVALDLSAFVKRARTAATYDFDNMQPGGYFFVEATEARPNPAKSMASTVSAANKKYADKPEAEQRTYVVAPFAEGETKGGYTAAKAGALIVRTK